jgi:hypothetical protein
MQLLIILLLLSISIHSQSGIIVGGFTAISTADLDEYQQEIDKFIREYVI